MDQKYALFREGVSNFDRALRGEMDRLVEHRPEWNHILGILSCTPFNNTSWLWCAMFELTHHLDIPKEECLLLHSFGHFAEEELQTQYPSILRCFFSSRSRAGMHFVDDKRLEEASLYLLGLLSDNDK